MFDQYSLAGQVPLQDRDLFHRLNEYFDTLDQRLQLGEGWLIFNAAGTRARRIMSFLQQRAPELRPMWSYLFLPWRDFSLTSYLIQVELKSIGEPGDENLSAPVKREFDIATRVSRQTMVHSVTADLLIVNGLQPQHAHEVDYFEETMERRYRDRLSTIILTPAQPHELAATVIQHGQSGEETWRRMYNRFYETNLMAI